MRTEKIKIQESWKLGKTVNENENDGSNPAAQNSLCFFFPYNAAIRLPAWSKPTFWFHYLEQILELKELCPIFESHKRCLVQFGLLAAKI
jgi:hypothetical protein